MEVTASEEAIASKESELKSLRETLLEKEYTLSDYTTRIEQVGFLVLYYLDGKRRKKDSNFLARNIHFSSCYGVLKDFAGFLLRFLNKV